MKRVIIAILIFIYFVSYSETAKSVATYHAMSSSGTGFDALIFNPAGLVFTERRLGISIWGNNYFRMYNNTFSTDDILEMDEKVALTDFIAQKITEMPDGGFEASWESESFSSMSFINFAYWNVGGYNKAKIESLFDGKYNKRSKTITRYFDSQYIRKKQEEKNYVNDKKNKKTLKYVNYIQIKNDQSNNRIKSVLIKYKEEDDKIDSKLDTYKKNETYLIPVNYKQELVDVKITFEKPVYQTEIEVYGMTSSYKERNYPSFLNDFAFGFGWRTKSEANFILGKKVVTTFFQELDLESDTEFEGSLDFKVYSDLFFSGSYRLKPVEKLLPFKTKISVGVGQHIYFPSAVFNFDGTLTLTKGEVGDNGFYSKYKLLLDGEGVSATSPVIKPILEAISEKGSGSDLGSTADILLKGSSFGIGLGWDFGYYMEFPFGISTGFAVTDLGFMVFPKAAKIRGLSGELFTTEGEANDFPKDVVEAIEGKKAVIESYMFMPDTAIRTGISMEPFKEWFKNFYFIGGMNFAVHSFDKIETREYPTFDWGMAVDFGPKVPLKNSVYDLRFPVRVGLNYNTDVFFPTASFGTGIIAGPVMMELSVTGIEFFIRKWGTRDINISADFKYMF